MENLPPRKKIKPANNRVDWNQRDLKYLKAIKKEYQHLKEIDYDQRLTISFLGR